MDNKVSHKQDTCDHAVIETVTRLDETFVCFSSNVLQKLMLPVRWCHCPLGAAAAPCRDEPEHSPPYSGYSEEGWGSTQTNVDTNSLDKQTDTPKHDKELKEAAESTQHAMKSRGVYCLKKQHSITAIKYLWQWLRPQNRSMGCSGRAWRMERLPVEGTPPLQKWLPSELRLTKPWRDEKGHIYWECNDLSAPIYVVVCEGTSADLSVAWDFWWGTSHAKWGRQHAGLYQSDCCMRHSSLGVVTKTAIQTFCNTDTHKSVM